jgi:putative endopeptidase
MLRLSCGGMSTRFLPLRLFTLLCLCALAAIAHAQEAGVDPQVLPGDDFFSYANGSWLKATQIPEGKGRWGARDDIADRTRGQVLEVLDAAKSAPAGSQARQVADFRAAWLDVAAIEAHGMAPVQPLLGRIVAIRNKADLTHFLGSELRADVDPMNLGVYDSAHLLGLAVQAGNHGEKEYVAYLVQGGLGLPGREDYLATDAAAQSRRAQYVDHIAHVLAQLAGSDWPAAAIKERADVVMALETAIARSHATPQASADDHNADTLWTRADFAREAPGMDWDAFFAAARLSKQQAFVAWQPAALKGVATLVATQPLQAWKDYLAVRVIARYADVLPGTQPDARAQRAVAATEAAMGEAVGRLYVERHFPPADKVRVQAITANVIAAFARRVEAATWMSPAAKATSLAKLKQVYFGIGYPDRWPQHANVAIDPADPVGNLQRLAQRDYAEALARLGQPVDHTVWPIVPQWPGAVLRFNENAHNFAAALLQAPKFDAAASDAANYGAIGAIVGHEVSHFVDGLGADYEVDGRLHRWWTFDDLARYDAATAPLVRQFSAYRPFPDVAVDGKLGLSENLADLGGLVAAFDAYRLSLGDKAADKAYVRAQDRQFFIGFARAWRVKFRDDALRKQAGSDHAPENFRVSTVRNLDAWYEAFDVKPGQRLYLEPAARVRVW